MYLDKKLVGKRFCAATNHPRLFKQTGWGYSDYEKNIKAGAFTDEEVKELSVNRNEFVKEFYITGILKFLPKQLPFSGFELLFDHHEFYISKKGLIFIISPYETALSCYGTLEEEMELLTKIGFNSYPKLYAKEALTFIQLFEDKKELDKFYATVSELLTPYFRKWRS
jgi:hypothetical protein